MIYFLVDDHGSTVLVRVPDECRGIHVHNSHYMDKIEHILASMDKYTH